MAVKPVAAVAAREAAALVAVRVQAAIANSLTATTSSTTPTPTNANTSKRCPRGRSLQGCLIDSSHPQVANQTVVDLRALYRMGSPVMRCLTKAGV